MDDLTAASLDDIRDFFAAYYRPNNAVLTIAGDFEKAEALALVQKHFGPIPAGPSAPPLPDMSLPDVFGQWKREVVPDSVPLPRLFLAFRSPAFGTDAYYAASVAGAVLGLRKGSRLYRSLVRDRQVAAEANAFTYDLTKGSDLLVLDVTARPGISAEMLEQEVAREIDVMFRDGITQAEVDRARALIESDLVRSMQSAGDRADKLSMYTTYFGKPELINELPAHYRAVTAKAVNRFIKSHLGENNRASLLFVPRESGSADEPLAAAASAA
jgi:predicted Zn-dependent peptidase